jgi:hypothetical protein
MSPFPIHMRDFKERWRLPQTPKNNIPNNIYAIDVEFMAHHQSEEYVAQMPDPAKHISK